MSEAVTLETHNRENHEHQKDYKCAYCGTWLLKLKNHVRIFHEKSQQFKCDICSKVFAFKFHLQKHTRKNHKHLPKEFNSENCNSKELARPELGRHITKKSHDETFAYFIPQDSLFQNLILPVIPIYLAIFKPNQVLLIAPSS